MIAYRLHENDNTLNSGERTMRKPPGNICGDSFYKLMDFCFECCEFLTFSVRWWAKGTMSKRTDAFFAKIEQFRVDSFKVTSWHRMNLNYEVCKGDFIDVHLYKCAPQLKAILMQITDNLYFEIYDDENKRYVTSHDIAEDICFFCENKLFLGTLSHAGLCTVYPRHFSDLSFFQSLVGISNCYWKPFEPVDKSRLESCFELNGKQFVSIY